MLQCTMCIIKRLQSSDSRHNPESEIFAATAKVIIELNLRDCITIVLFTTGENEFGDDVSSIRNSAFRRANDGFELIYKSFFNRFFNCVNFQCGEYRKENIQKYSYA